jgi:hypothetical protein
MGRHDPPRLFEDLEMKIHLLPPLPFLPPAAPQKAPPTALQIEQMTEELVETARNWRAQRDKLSKVRKNRHRSDQNADPDRSTSDKRLSEDKVDVIA